MVGFVTLAVLLTQCFAGNFSDENRTYIAIPNQPMQNALRYDQPVVCGSGILGIGCTVGAPLKADTYWGSEAEAAEPCWLVSVPPITSKTEWRALFSIRDMSPVRDCWKAARKTNTSDILSNASEHKYSLMCHRFILIVMHIFIIQPSTKCYLFQFENNFVIFSDEIHVNNSTEWSFHLLFPQRQ